MKRYFGLMCGMGIIALTIVLLTNGFNPAVAGDIENTAVALKGKKFEYRLGEYHLRLSFLDETRLEWLYLAAPNGLTGKSAVQDIDRRDIGPGLVLMAWDEADGSRVIDVLDLNANVLHANFVLPDKKRFFLKADILPVP